MCCECNQFKINRRDFMGLSAMGLAAAGMIAPSLSAGSTLQEWDPEKPFKVNAQKLRVQPVLLYSIPTRKPQVSWRPWGGLHTEKDVAIEATRIIKELNELEKKSDALEILPLVKVNSLEKAVAFEKSKDYDVPIVYAAAGDTGMLEAIVSDKRNNLIFLRHRSGPVYLWYEIIHNRFLRKGGKEFELDEYRNPAGMNIHDIIVDDYDELLYKLRGLYAVKNFMGQKVVALGGSGGWCCPLAPSVSQDKFNFNIQTVEYDDLAKRIQSARANTALKAKAEKWTNTYLSMLDTTLHTERQFVVNAFILYSIFKDLLNEHNANAFTIKSCMGTVIPMAETTACLPLSLLNDEGAMAFCESDFNVIPSGVLLYYLAGKPVFLNDPTYPHHGMVTAAHCTAPRRMDGKNYALAKVVTHFESDYGATPKVELPIGTPITMVCPDSGQKEWLGFTGTIEENPFYDICRSQYDIKIDGNWKKLLADHRGFHWMMACGDYTREMEYACGKINVNWKNISDVYSV